MDYIEAFKNLKTNNKYSRKSPHKAVLLLTVIEMFENNSLTDNVICYDDILKNTFLKVWQKVLKDETLFHPEAYLPFWFLQSEDFWHIVPNRGKEEILPLMRDKHVKPSESKIVECVNYAELDADLYFLMTLQSGRSSLKRVLLESYFDLPDDMIDKLAESIDNTVDYSVSAISDFEQLVTKNASNRPEGESSIDENLVNQFRGLDFDLQLVLNIEYYTFQKKNRNLRIEFGETFKTVYDLLDHIINNPIKRTDISSSLAIAYDNFLSDLRITLMGEDGSFDLVDKIGSALDVLRGLNREDDVIINEVKEKQESEGINSNISKIFSIPSPPNRGAHKDNETLELKENSEDRKGKPWTQNEEELLGLYFKKYDDFATIANKMGRTVIAIKSRLAKLGLIDYVYEADEAEKQQPSSITDESKETDFTIENTSVRCSLFNKKGDRVFSTEGKLKFIKGKLYRINLKYECFTVKGMRYINGLWTKGEKKIVAYPKSELYGIMNKNTDYSVCIEDIDDSAVFEDCRIKVNGKWYRYNGNPFSSDSSTRNNDTQKSEITTCDVDDDKISSFSVKIGETLKLFPSQLVGTVTRLRIDKFGHKKIVVQTGDGPVVEIYDSKYLYQKIGNQEKKAEKSKTNKKDEQRKDSLRKDDGILIDQYAEIGSWVKMKSDGVIGQVLYKFSAGSIKRMIVRTKSGYEIECDDNKDSYEIIKGTSKTTREIKETPQKQQKEIGDNVTSPAEELFHGGIIRVGDWIKTNFFNDKCQVKRIERNGSFYEKLIVQFEDGREDWIINKPDLYKIVATAPLDEGIKKEIKDGGEVHRAARIGDRVMRLSDNLVGTVVGVKPLLGGIEKLILELDNGGSAEVFNDLHMYKVIL